METISKAEFDALANSSKVLVGTDYRVGILLTPENDIVKCFYHRKLISRSRLYSKAERFAANAALLAQRGINAPQIKRVFNCPDLPMEAVTYGLMDGVDLIEELAQGDYTSLAALPEYLVHLHNKGIFFRAIHLGNVLKLASGEFGLIDFSDLKCHSGSLGAYTRARNLAHMMNTTADEVFYIQFGINKFITAYLDAAKLGSVQSKIFNWRFYSALNPKLQQLARA